MICIRNKLTCITVFALQCQAGEVDNSNSSLSCIINIFAASIEINKSRVKRKRSLTGMCVYDVYVLVCVCVCLFTVYTYSERFCQVYKFDLI